MVVWATECFSQSVTSDQSITSDYNVIDLNYETKCLQYHVVKPVFIIALLI